MCVGMVLLAMSAGAGASEVVSAWSTVQPETQARLLAAKSANNTTALIEIALSDGWKTYWRFPGDAGGVPPTFDFSKSDNLAKATVLYPAPQRLTDKAGDTLGYKTNVAFPVLVEAKDKTKPVSLRLTVEYGICKDVCIPVEAELAVDVPTEASAALPAAVIAALAAVPRTVGAALPNDPKLLKVEVNLDGPQPTIVIDAEFPGGTAGADAFVESPAGFYIPLPKQSSTKDIGTNRLRFAVDLAGAVDPADIKGKFAMVTLVSKQGLSETTFKLD
jgi:DsbC/DsbD-like thiol-disulfide interchange protein